MKRTYVGSLACQRDSSLLKGFQTTVVSCEAVDSKDNKEGPPMYHVELHDTILFPEGGGQPSDTGVLKVLDGPNANESVVVSHVAREGLHAKHCVDNLIEPGTKVEITVDSGRRIDYMQQHTGQHLLSALLEQKYDLRTLSWSMGEIPNDKKGPLEINDYFNYLEIPRRMSEQEIRDLSDAMNHYILVEPMSISIREATREAVGSLNTDKIPDDYDLSKGIVRTVHIGTMDANPCCGTHLKETGQIGSILILPNQTTVRGTNSRLYFMCGQRVNKYGEMASEILTKTKAKLSCQEAQIPDKIEKQKDQIQKLSKREQYWMRELAAYESKAIIEQLKQNRKAYLLKDTFGTLEYLLHILKEIRPACQGMPNYILLLCGRDRQTETGSIIILSTSGEDISRISGKLSSCFRCIKGGGGSSGGKWQAKMAKVTNQEWTALEEFVAFEFKLGT
ncbi:hypothetical protein HG536_0G01500 [Torulaspora globosa]|uniref:Threonyl/alanyl tRNA synthetase SAD domain-containing protein n=1 Tax=Torulaspora globosa TaxID=48254 RepID=A0A7G3ZLA5_9SACH|nr:uncharacterized protein HG536_0G01500 [Torulaspora globosa]QLL34291.1 hypothetical protein HG536_0G01500 [Torulaspora globosa]